MPIIKSAKKAARQALKRTKQNEQTKKLIKQAAKSFKAKPTASSLSYAQSELDKAVKKGLLKKNTASRRKAALAKLGKSSGVKLTTTAKKTTPTPPTKTAAQKPTAKPAATKTTKTPAKKPVAKAKNQNLR